MPLSVGIANREPLPGHRFDNPCQAHLTRSYDLGRGMPCHKSSDKPRKIDPTMHSSVHRCTAPL